MLIGLLLKAFKQSSMYKHLAAAACRFTGKTGASGGEYECVAKVDSVALGLGKV